MQDAPGAGDGADTPRERILQAAARLFAEHGFHATGMKELERETGLGRSSLYYQFSSKEEILFEILTRYLRALIAYGNGLLAEPMTAEERLRALSRRVMETIAHHRPELTVCFREQHAIGAERHEAVQALHRDYEAVWAAVLQRGVDDGSFRRGGPFTVKALLGLHHYSYLWLRPDGSRTPREIADEFVDLVLDGLASGD
ncbi:TetR/AcrR family transcriptional regulator [Arhodomonas aquaeolei]|nr:MULTISPECIES: TetR/AcrR family transcriptional regulator [Arhodomonas]MCS4502546.1 TetR/AcrR family transcriptional regulator [Arhodomonas aquaeolei]